MPDPGRFDLRSGFSVSGVLATGLTVWLRNLPKLIGVVALIFSPIAVRTALVIAESTPRTRHEPGWLDMGINFFLHHAAIAMVVVLVGHLLRNERLNLSQALAACLHRILPVLGVGLSIALAACLVIFANVTIVAMARLPREPVSLTLALTPSLLLTLHLLSRWWVAIPVVMHEDTGTLKALHRSSSLTSGHRWQIFWILLVLLAIGFGIGQAWGLLTATAIELNLVGQFVLTLLAVSLSATVCAVGYRTLHFAGPTPSRPMRADTDSGLRQTGTEQIDAGNAWTCSKCGEIIEGQFEVCWNCQHPRDLGDS